VWAVGREQWLCLMMVQVSSPNSARESLALATTNRLPHSNALAAHRMWRRTEL
jgi:hypothetical protein